MSAPKFVQYFRGVRQKVHTSNSSKADGSSSCMARRGASCKLWKNKPDGTCSTLRCMKFRRFTRVPSWPSQFVQCPSFSLSSTKVAVIGRNNRKMFAGESGETIVTTFGRYDFFPSNFSIPGKAHDRSSIRGASSSRFCISDHARCMPPRSSFLSSQPPFGWGTSS